MNNVDTNGIRNLVEKLLEVNELSCSTWLDDDGNLVLSVDDMKESIEIGLETYSPAADDWKVV